MARKHPRLAITMSPAMTVAVGILAEREDAAPAVVARRLMRAALDRTIHSAECQDRLRAMGHAGSEARADGAQR